jgi:hypothetical protein
VAFSIAAKDRLTTHDLGRFPAGTLFDRLARAVCTAGCLPRKELYEAWEVARRVRRRVRGGRIVDVGGGHGLLGPVLLLLDDSSDAAVILDVATPPSATTLHAALVETWPRLAGRVAHARGSLDGFRLLSGDVVVSSHACGAVTERILEAAAEARVPVAVLPCCHDAATCDPGPLRGWLDLGIAVDAVRAVRLEARGYRVWTQRIPEAITPQHRLLLGVPDERPINADGADSGAQ